MSPAAVSLAAGGAALAVAVLMRPHPSGPRPGPVRGPGPVGGVPTGGPGRLRLLGSAVAALAALVFVGGRPGPVAAIVVGVGCWLLLDRAEPAEVSRRRAQVRRDLPHVVALFAATLRAGAAPGEGVAIVSASLPGPASDRLSVVAARLSLGLDPARVWSDLAADPDLGRLGRTMARAHGSGAPVVAAIERLADDLAAVARADAEQRARTVGVKAAVPLGLCLLPAFLLVGIVPLAVSLLTTIDVG